MIEAKHVFLFSGPGAQQVGMGRDLAEWRPAIRDLFSRADAIVGFPLSKVLWGA
jgi:[acyl-carrier-protein] S-malonyltransferase